ncbi:hypothetical protein A6R68_10092 [Neotoma lepida]|uniref:Uncharacterized protein n=1 Tax=Neotoma lepida TaxID=56216 RepID=A0A1A6FYU0_NEOLE|nr:hypothetical protein A6R68_10092 [Neotoma lepida]
MEVCSIFRIWLISTDLTLWSQARLLLQIRHLAGSPASCNILRNSNYIPG